MEQEKIAGRSKFLPIALPILLILMLVGGANAGWIKEYHDFNNSGLSEYNYTGNGTETVNYALRIISSIVTDETKIYAFQKPSSPPYYDKMIAVYKNNGSIAWSLQESNNIVCYGAPAIDINSNLVYFGCGNGKLHAIYLNNGTEKFSFSLPDAMSNSVMHITFDNSEVYLDNLYLDGGVQHDSIDAISKDGSLVWRTNLSNEVVSGIALNNNYIYVTTSSHNLYKLDTSGSIIWDFATGCRYVTAPVVSDAVYIADGCGDIYGINFDESLKWTYTVASGEIDYPLALDNNNLYVGDYSGVLYKFDLNGNVIWTKQVDDWTVTSPTVDDNLIYIGTENYTDGFSYLSSIFKNGTLNFRKQFTSDPLNVIIGMNKSLYVPVWELYVFDSQAPEPPSGLSGHVYFQDIDNITHPLPGAFVYINDTLKATTDSSGYYSIPNVPNGVYTLYVSRSDFTTESKTISNATLNNDFVLKYSQGFRFVQLTDVHIGPDPTLCGWGNSGSLACLLLSRITSVDKFHAVIDDVISHKPDFVLITGDLVEWNNPSQYTDFNKLVSKFQENNIKVYIVPGNHDRRGKENPLIILDTICPEILGYDCFNDLNNYRNYIGSNDSSGVYKYEDGDYFEANNGYRFIGLDSGYDASLNPSSPVGSGLSPNQINFTRDNITNGKTIIFMHHPAIDVNNCYNVISENRNQFINLAYDKNVKLVLTGHTHDSKIFNKDGNNYSYCYDRSGTVSNGNIISTCKILDNPLFVQTKSATKDDTTPHGYLRVDSGIDKYLNNQIKLENVIMTGKDSSPLHYVYLHSPADLHIFDESGRHTGLNATGNIDDNIPDSYYFEEYKLGNITLPAFALLYNTTLNYSIKIVSNFSRENITSNQSVFNFTMESRTGNEITTINYNNVSINRNSIADLQINTTQTNYTMQIDLNNDSIIDATKQPDAIETDYAPIATIISPANGSTWDQGQTVTFNGSGIDREDGTLNKFTWISDRDAVIGHGNFTTANLSAGVHNITLLINDSTGLVNTSNIVITIRDTMPPLLNIEYPPENKIFNRQNITVRGIAYDDSGILNVTVNGLEAGRENWNAIVSLNEGQNIINFTATDNKGLSTIANRTVYYKSSLANDTEPPAAVTNLTHKTGYDNVNRAWINWTWDNPKDADFSYVMIYLDNIFMGNTSKSYFNITGLSSNANYTITIQSADVVDNINLTEIKDTARTVQTFPEAEIGFDTTIKDFKVYNTKIGIEANYVILPSNDNNDTKEMDEDNEKGWELRQYTLKDYANNSLVLVLKHKKEGNEAEVKIISMQYNDGTIMLSPKNKIQAEYSYEMSALKELEQKIEVHKLFDAEAKYSDKKGETKIKVKIEGQKEQKETRTGIVILELLTDKGGLKLWH